MAPDFTAHIRREGSLFRAALAGVDPATPVPTCPEWTAYDLLHHLGGVQWWWSTIVEGRLSAPPGDDDRGQPDDYPGLLRYLDEQHARLLDALGRAGDDESVWTWSRTHTVGFIRRRMAQEALIHRLDAELTAGGPVSAVDAALAADGVHEMVQYMFCGPQWSAFTASGPVGRLRALDTGTDHVVQVGSVTGTSPDGERSYDREPAFRETDAGAVARFTVSASARDLDAWLWGRPTLADVAVDGDADDFATFEAIVRAS